VAQEEEEEAKLGQLILSWMSGGVDGSLSTFLIICVLYS
jgi:hypothetical protein